MDFFPLPDVPEHNPHLEQLDLYPDSLLAGQFMYWPSFVSVAIKLLYPNFSAFNCCAGVCVEAIKKRPKDLFLCH